MMKKSRQVESSEEISSENVPYNDSESENAADGDASLKEPTLQSSQSSTAPEDEDLPSDGSDAPVGVSWKDSKTIFQQDERNKNDSVNFAKAVDKAQRRKKNELFVSQKETKRKYELTKLPEEIVQALAKKPKQLDLDEIDKDKKLEKVKKLKKRKKKEKNRKVEENCHVVILEEELNKPKKVQESAAKFLKNHLYGDRLQRTSGSMQLTFQCKSSGIMKPAVKFNTKD